MAPPSWLAAVLAAILLVIAGYCATRLAAARWRQRSTDHGADVMHTVMGVAMAGMLVPRLNPLQARAWAVPFAAGAAWLPALRPAPVPVTTAPAQAMPTTATGQDAAAGSTPAPAGARPVLCPRLAACCQIMMGVTMAYMLILML